VPGDDEVLVRVKAASVNPLDWHFMRGSPYIMRFMSGLGAPNDKRLGADFAGVVESVGKNVAGFGIGDAIFGNGNGAFAEYATKNAKGSLAKIPSNVSFEQAAALPVAGITALQALCDHGRLEAGQHVLINGASGGVGTFAVQIAKSLGATITGVCSKRNREMVLSIGADRVIDYRQTNYTESEEKYDLIIDMIGNHSFTANLDVLKPTGRLVVVGGQKGDWIGPLTNMLKEPFLSPFVDQEIVVMLAHSNATDLAELASLVANGDLVPVIDQRYSLDDVREAVAYSEEGRARGKIIVHMD
jgi:NADPH:quinone reductase-like Zn-dependent oxidoreductase